MLQHLRFVSHLKCSANSNYHHRLVTFIPLNCRGVSCVEAMEFVFSWVGSVRASVGILLGLCPKSGSHDCMCLYNGGTQVGSLWAEVCIPHHNLG